MLWNRAGETGWILKPLGLLYGIQETEAAVGAIPKCAQTQIFYHIYRRLLVLFHCVRWLQKVLLFSTFLEW